jgi:hypothetical protein
MQKIHEYVSSFWMISLHPRICALQLHNLTLEEMMICKNVFDNHICFELGKKKFELFACILMD